MTSFSSYSLARIYDLLEEAESSAKEEGMILSEDLSDIVDRIRVILAMNNIQQELFCLNLNGATQKVASSNQFFKTALEIYQEQKRENGKG